VILAALLLLAGAGEPFESLEKVIESLEGKGSLRFGGLFAADWIQRDRRNADDPGPAFEARPRLDGRRTDGYRFSLEADLVGADVPYNVREAWVGWSSSDALLVRAGLVGIPLGTEAATRPEDLPLPGRSFTSFLTARTDVGLQAEGTWGLLGWQATAAAGHGFGLDGRPRSSPMAALRAVARPVEGIHVGLGAARLFDFEDPLALETPLGDTVFLTRDLDGDGGRFLLGEAGFALGPVAGGIEVVRGSASGVTDRGGRRTSMDQLTAWTGSVAWRILGEGRGILELGLRYSNADMDRRLFAAGWTTYDPSAQEIRTFSAMLGWRPTTHLRVALGWVKTISDDALGVYGGGGPSTTPRVPGGNRDSSFVLRLEVAF
jgi:hypothetical protein